MARLRNTQNDFLGVKEDNQLRVPKTTKQMQEAARRKIQYGQKKGNTEPTGVQKAVGKASNLADNWDWLLKKGSGNRLHLPSGIKKPLKRAGF